MCSTFSLFVTVIVCKCLRLCLCVCVTVFVIMFLVVCVYGFLCSFTPLGSSTIVDSSSQITNPRASQQNGRTTISFTLPCNSSDSQDIALASEPRYLVFATGDVVNNAVSFDNQLRWITSERLPISCEGLPLL